MIPTFSGKLTYWSVWFVEKCMHNCGRNSNINILDFMSMPQNHQQLSTLYTKAETWSEINCYSLNSVFRMKTGIPVE